MSAADACVPSAPPAPFSIRSIAAEVATTYRAEWRPLLLLASIIELPLVVAEITLHVTPSLRGLVAEESFAGLVAALTLYGSLSHHFVAGVLERVVAANRHGHQRPGVREVLRNLPWLRLLVADLMLTALMVLGLALFILPGLVFATWFALTLPLINLEGRPVLGAFARSRQLVRGHSWRVAAIAISAFVVPAAIIGTIAAVTHTGTLPVDALIHAIAATVLLPAASLPLVIATFDLVAAERTTATAWTKCPSS